MDRFTGRVCMSISAKAMSITGIEDRRYWNWIPTEESRFVLESYWCYKLYSICIVHLVNCGENFNLGECICFNIFVYNNFIVLSTGFDLRVVSQIIQEKIYK